MSAIIEPTLSEEELLSTLMVDIYKIMGLPEKSWLRRPARRLVQAPLLRFCRKFAQTDAIMDRDGFGKAARFLALPSFTRSIHVRGESSVPKDGPLVVVSNHPGAIDSVAIGASLGREDLKVIASNVPFLQRLPTVSQHLIFIADDSITRMGVIRQSIHHLQEGGSLLIFPTGLIDPDPSLMPGALESLQNWSNSVEIFLRKVPQTRLVQTVVSGVLHPRSINHPLTKLQKERWKKQRMAEFLQLAWQLLFPGSLPVEPRISFGLPASLAELENESSQRRLHEVVIQREAALLDEHRAAYYGESYDCQPARAISSVDG